MGQDRGGSSIGPVNSPTLLTYDRGGPRTIANPLYVDPREASYVTSAGGNLFNGWKGVDAKWTPGQYKSVAEFMAARPKGDYFTGHIPQGAAEHGQTVGPTFYESHQLAADTAAWTKYGIDNGFIPKDGGMWGGFKDAFLNPAVLAAVGGFALAPAGAGSAATNLSADQLMAQSVAGLSTATPLETATALGIGGAAAGGASGVAAASETGTGAGVGSGTTAGNVAASAPAAGGVSTASKALATAKAISEYGSAAMTIGSLIAGGGGSVDVPSPDTPPAPPTTQGAKEPDYAGIRQKVPGGLSSGNLSTLLTGASGIDPATLMLGKSLLLGS